jgi:O-antigen/teichoic acid export membrane protein
MMRRHLHLAGNLLPLVAGLATAPLTARALGATGRGQLALILAVSAVLMTVAAFGLPWVARSDLQRDPKTLSWWRRRARILGLAALPIAVSVALGVVVVLGLSPQEGIPVVALYALSAFAASRGVEGNALISMRRPDLYGAANVAGIAVNVAGVAVLFAFSTLSLTAAVWLSFASIAVQFGLTVFLVGRIAASVPAVQPDFASSPLAIRAMRSWGAQTTEAVSTKADVLLIAVSASSATLGLYSVVSLLPQTVYALMITIVQKSYARGTVASREEHFSRLMQTCLIAGAAVTVLAAPALWLLVPILFGDAFIGARDLVVPGCCVALGLSAAAPIGQRISGGEASALPFALIVAGSAALSLGVGTLGGVQWMLACFGLIMVTACAGYAIVVTRGRIFSVSFRELARWWRDE